MPTQDLHLRTDHITLDALLKASGLAASGGDAKALIAGGGVRVNGVADARRGRKLRPGDVVHWGEHEVRVHGPDAPAPVHNGAPPG